MYRTRIATVLLCLSTAAWAGPDPNGWSGEAGAGYLASNGNTKSSSLNAKLALDYVHNQWKNAFLATAFGASDQQEATGERYTASDKLDYNFSERDYAFGAVEYEKDLFGPVGQRTVESVGYGRHILTGPVHVLDADIGVGARQSTANVTDERSNDAIARLGGKYTWNISATSAFNETLSVETGSSNTYTQSITELKFNVVGNIFASSSYTIRNNSHVPAGTGRTDTVTALNLSYTFGAKAK